MDITKSRLEAFSDGVLAIIITIMVIELPLPEGVEWSAFKRVIPFFLSYILSFVMVGIYWGNHHHLIHTVIHVNSKIIWANLHLLFWLSLLPFATEYMGFYSFQTRTVAVYAFLSSICSVAYYILLKIIMNSLRQKYLVYSSLEKQSKRCIFSIVAYLTAIPAAFINVLIPASIFILVAFFWWIPDRNIEKAMKDSDLHE